MPRPRQPLTVEKLRRVLDYDARTGILTWREKPSVAVKVGDAAGSKDARGYVRIGIENTVHAAHRLAWMHHTGQEPEGEIDHINGNKSDNRIDNLRDVPREINRQNLQRPRRHNKSGILGVAIGQRPGTWNAHISHGGKQIHLGTFDSPKEASDAYIAAKRRLHPGCTI